MKRLLVALLFTIAAASPASSQLIPPSPTPPAASSECGTVDPALDLDPVWALSCSHCLSSEPTRSFASLPTLPVFPTLTPPGWVPTTIPFTPTSIPTSIPTSTPTSTPISTPTATPLAAISPAWCYTIPNIFFNVWTKGTYDSLLDQWVGVSSTAGGSSPNHSVGITYIFPSSASLVRVETSHVAQGAPPPADSFPVFYWRSSSSINYNFSSPYQGGYSQWASSTPVSTNSISIWLNTARATSISYLSSADATIRAVRLSGVGTNPFPVNHCAPATPFPTPTSPSTPTPIPALPSPSPVYPTFLANVDCRSPVYSDISTPVVAVDLIPTSTSCFIAFPAFSFTPPDFFGFTFPTVSSPGIELCIQFYSFTLSLAGFVIDIASFVSSILALFVVRWALFN